MASLKKANSINLSDSSFDELSPKYQLVVLEDEKNSAQQDLAFAIKAYENLQKKSLTAKEMIGEQVSESVAEVKELFNEMRASMLKSINPLLEAFDDPMGVLDEYDKSDELLDAAVNAIVEPLVKALEPFLDLDGMPDLPLLGSLKDIIQSIKDMGRIQRETKKYLKKNKKNKKDKEESAAEDKRSFMEKLNDSEVGKVCAEVVKLLIVLAQQLVMFIMFFFYYLISELIDLLKPVFEAFGIIAGTFIGMLTKLNDVLKGGFNIGALILLIMKLIWEKLQSIFNILYIFNPEDKSDQLEAMRHMIAENRVRIEYCGVNMNASIAQLQSDEFNRKRYDRKQDIKQTRKNAESYADYTKQKAEDFKNEIDSRIKKYEEELQGNGPNVPNAGASESTEETEKSDK